MLKIGDKVKTGYGKGKIIKIREIPPIWGCDYVYLVKYNLFKRMWCFEESVEKVGMINDKNSKKK